jgi:hypothetical protein
MPDELYIWVNKWDEFQSFQKKRGKPWAPPWIKIYPQLLDDYDFVGLPWQTQLVLLKVFMAFSQTRGRLSADTRELSRQLAQRVTRAQLDSLSHAGWIELCSRTVLEQRRNAFWNSSALEVEGEETKPSIPNPAVDVAGADDDIPDFDELEESIHNGTVVVTKDLSAL